MRSSPEVVPSQIVYAAEPAIAYERSLIAASREGVSRDAFVDFARTIKQSVQELSKVIPASYSTLSKKTLFDQDTSERIFEIAQVYAQGREVFGNIDRFNSWVMSPSIALGGDIPFSLLDTSFGIALVKQELGRIDHGIFA